MESDNPERWYPPPPLDWVCIDASDPSSCYGRYANDPFDDDMVNAKLEYDPRTNTVNLYSTREILRGEEIYVATGMVSQGSHS